MDACGNRRQLRSAFRDPFRRADDAARAAVHRVVRRQPAYRLAGAFWARTAHLCRGRVASDHARRGLYVEDGWPDRQHRGRQVRRFRRARGRSAAVAPEKLEGCPCWGTVSAGRPSRRRRHFDAHNAADCDRRIPRAPARQRSSIIYSGSGGGLPCWSMISARSISTRNSSPSHNGNTIGFSQRVHLLQHRRYSGRGPHRAQPGQRTCPTTSSSRRVASPIRPDCRDSLSRSFATAFRHHRRGGCRTGARARPRQVRRRHGPKADRRRRHPDPEQDGSGE